MQPKIKGFKAIEILDSRGNPTLKVKCYLDNGVAGSACIPSGASTGKWEAVELRDGDKNRFKGKGVLKAKENVEKKISQALQGLSPFEQRKIDEKLIELDGTENKSKLGANAILGVSLACARAAAHSVNQPLYKYLQGTDKAKLPIPMMNVINGGKHADNPLDIQEFMIVPTGFSSFSERLRASCEVFWTLKEILKSKGFSTSVGDEGGFAPSISSTKEVFDILSRAVENAGYKLKEEFNFAFDCAASEFYNSDKGVYHLEGREFSSIELVNFYKKLIQGYPIISIEDGMDQEDWEGWKLLTEESGSKTLIVGDDLFVTNTKRIQRGINQKVANAVLIKLNQIGTLTETLDAISLAHKNGYQTVISHRSGETEDTFISDLAVAAGSGFIKTGSLSRGERTAKYNRLLEIEDELS